MSLKFLLAAIILFLSSLIHAQAWHRQVIRDEVSINFPAEPRHQQIDDSGREAYLYQGDGFAFMVGVASNIIEDYNSYLKLSDSGRVSEALQTLEGVATGKINSRKQHLISMKSFHTKNYIGLDVEYATLEPSNPDSRKRYSNLLLIKNTVYIFDCWYLDDKEHDMERDKFFKSIQLKGRKE